MDLVSADYYEQGISYQQQIDRINLGHKNVYNLLVEYKRTEQVLRVHFPDSMDTRSISGAITLFRPADARQDQKIPLIIGNDHQQSIDLHNLVKGLWRIKIAWQNEELKCYQEEVLIID
jgi:hypothetical protein